MHQRWKRGFALVLALCMCVGLLPVTAAAADRDISEILEAALQIIYTNEGSYSSVNAADNGAVSVGKLQWHGNRALSLLKTICEANPEQALELLGEDLYNEITTASAAAWSSRTVNSTEKEAISALLSTTEGQAAQDTLAAANVTNYIENGVKLGIVNGDALVYFADLENNGGSGASKRIATAAAAVQGSFDQVTPLSLYNATLEDSVMGKSLYLLRRYRTYTYCRNLGWTTATLSTPTLSVDSTAIDGSVTLSWTESSGADGYYIYRASGETSYAYTLAGTVTGGGTTTYTDTVTEEGSYNYRIIAYQGVNQSGESNQAPVTVEIGFTDVSASSYYYDAVVWALENGITNGTNATTFSPDDGCTRAQFATFLYRLAGEPELQGTENPFSDVKDSGADAVYYNAILWAYENGITTGTSATTFIPDDAITREDAVAMLYHYATLVNGGTAPTAGSSNPFSDVVNDEAHAYSYNAILWAYGQEITNGTSSTTFSPGDTCERAMMVTFLYRFVNSASYLSADDSVSAVSEEDSAVSGGEAAAAEDGEVEEAGAVSEEESAGGEEADAVSEGQEEPLLEE